MTPIDNDVLPRWFSREDVVSTVEEWARSYAPSRFVVYGITDAPDDAGYDGEVLAWGLCFADHVSVQAVDANTGGKFGSVESMRRIMFRGDRDIRLLWLDPDPPPPGG